MPDRAARKTIGYLTPSCGSHTQTWSERMISHLEEDIILIGANRFINPSDRSGICISLAPRGKLSRILSLSEKVLKLDLYVRLLTLRLVLCLKRPDVLLINFADFALRTLPAWRNTKAQVFIHCHGADVAFQALSDEPPHPRLHSDSYVEQVLMLENKVQFIANSTNTVDVLREIGIRQQKIHLKYFGVPLPPERRRFSDEKELSALFVGRLVEWKGPHSVIEAVVLLRARGIRLNLVVVGGGPLEERCRQLIAEKNAESYINMVGEMGYESARKFFAESQIFLSHQNRGEITGRVEAFGVVFLEAMAHELCVITCRSGGVEDIITSEVDGILVQPGDVEAFCDAAEKVCRDFEYRQKLAKRARDTVEERFSMGMEKDKLRSILDV